MTIPFMPSEQKTNIASAARNQYLVFTTSSQARQQITYNYKALD